MDTFTTAPQIDTKRSFQRFVFVCVTCFGIFLWLKLRLVSNVPKTAYADPEQFGPTLQTQSECVPADPISDAERAVEGNGHALDLINEVQRSF
ncbi:MAG: hypothetical protein ACK54H_06100 [Phycisphaerales bacterium]